MIRRHDKIVLGGARAALLVFQLIQTVLFARVMDVGELGLFLVFLTYSVLLAKLGQAGLGLTAVREISTLLVTHNRSAVDQETISLLVCLCSTAALVSIGASVSALVLPKIGIGGELLRVFVWGSALLLVHALTFALADFNRAFGDQKLAAVFSFVVPGLIQTTGMMIAWSFGKSIPIHWMVSLWIVSFLFPAVVLGRSILRQVNERTVVRIGKSLRKAVANWPNAGLILLYHCAVYSDLWLVSFLFGKEQAGIYGMAVALSLVLSIPGQINVQVLSPRIARSLSTGGNTLETLRVLVRGSAGIVTLLTLAGYLVVATIGSEGYGKILGDDVAGGFQIFLVLGFSQVVQSMFGPGGSIMSMSGRYRQTFFIVFACFGLGIAAALALWTRFGSPLAIAAGFAVGPVSYRFVLALTSSFTVGIKPFPSFRIDFMKRAWHEM